MIYYITGDTKHNVVETDNIKVLSFDQGFKEVGYLLKAHQDIYLDTETTGLDANFNKLSLIQIGDGGDDQYVIDVINNPTIDFSPLKRLESNRIIGHNLKFDIKFLRQINIDCRNIFDTLIAEQRIRQGFSGNEKCGGLSKNRLVSNDDNPDSLLFRYLGKNPNDLDKSIRLQAFGDINKIAFDNDAIIYAANDIKYLKFVKELQQAFIEKFGLQHIIYNVEFPLCAIVADMELEGFQFNDKKWLDIEDKHKQLMFEQEVILDKLVIEKYAPKAPKEYRDYFKGGKYRRERIKTDYVPTTDLFGETIFNKKQYDSFRKRRNSAYINWGSPKEILELFSKLGLELPTKYGSKGVPIIDKNGKLVKTEDFTTGASDLTLFLEENPNSKSKEILEKLLKYRTYQAYISKYGSSWIGKFLKPNGKVYTIFRQSTAVNGRFQSGGGRENDSDKYNAQNIPRLVDFRECFHAGEDNSIITIDLSGAEVTIMADKANDAWLYEMAVIKDDVHSPVIQECWRNIYKYRAGKKLGIWETPKEYKYNKNNPKFIQYLETTLDSKVQELYKLSKAFIVSKKENKEFRVSGKNLTFGSVYGCGPKKAAKTVGINIDEGQVYLNTIKEMIPKTFKYVERQAELACAKGLIRIDNYSNACIWFPSTIRAARQGRDLTFDEKIEIGNQARNITISGTQANMIKEAMVNIVKYLIDNNLYDKVKILSQVHDELVIKCPKEFDGISEQFKNNPKFFSYKDKEDTLPNILKQIFEESATLYLEHFTMKSDMEIKDTWTK